MTNPFQPPTITIKATTVTRTLSVAPYADRPVIIDVQKLKPANPFLEVTVQSGHARIHSSDGGGNVNEVDPKGVAFCATQSTCTCGETLPRTTRDSRTVISRSPAVRPAARCCSASAPATSNPAPASAGSRPAITR